MQTYGVPTSDFRQFWIQTGKVETDGLMASSLVTWLSCAKWLHFLWESLWYFMSLSYSKQKSQNSNVNNIWQKVFQGFMKRSSITIESLFRLAVSLSAVDKRSGKENLIVWINGKQHIYLHSDFYLYMKKLVSFTPALLESVLLRLFK